MATPSWLRTFGSPRMALYGMVPLAIASILSYGNPESTPAWVLAVPLFFLSLILLVAIVTNPRIYRPKGLLVFHVSLLLLVVFVAFGRLSYFEAHVEMVSGKAFTTDELLRVKSGVLHRGDLEGVEFIQGNYTVQYSAGLVRGLTRSQVFIPSGSEESGWQQELVGDDIPLVINGYRFYTSFNKGFAPLLTWVPADGSEPISGTIHMPSYPMFEHKQDNTWQPPGVEDEIRFWLQLDTGFTLENAWVLNGENASGVLVVNHGEQRIELMEGDEVKLASGTLRYDKLLTWMGYKIFYDPTLFWLFVTSTLSVLGLMVHFWKKFGAILPVTDKIPSVERGKKVVKV